MNRTRTVGLLESLVVPALDGSGEALTFACSADVYYLACREEVGLDYVAYIESGNVLKSEFLERLLEGDVRLLEVTRKRLLEALGGSVPEAELAAARERFAAESAEVRRRMEGYQTQVAVGADFAALVRMHSDVTAPLRVTRAELEAGLPPELARLLLETPVGAVTDIIELSGALAMYQVVAREGDDLTLLALAQTLPEQDDGLADALLQRRREAAFWAWFEEAFRNHRVRSPLFPDLAPAQ